MPLTKPLDTRVRSLPAREERLQRQYLHFCTSKACKLRTCVSVDAGALAGADAFCEDNMQALVHPVFLARLMLEHYGRLSPAAARARQYVSIRQHTSAYVC